MLMVHPVLAGGVFLLAYAAACLLGRALPLVPPAASASWMASGVLVGAFIRFPPARSLLLAAAALAAGLLISVAGAPLPGESALLVAAQIAACLAAAWAYRVLVRCRRAQRVSVDFGRTLPVVWFLVVAFGGAVLISTVGLGAASTVFDVATPLHTWVRATASHLLGIMLVAPFWLVADDEWRALRGTMTMARVAEAAAALALLALALHEAYIAPNDTPRAYLVLPLLLWLTLRFRMPGACAGMLVASATAVGATNAGLGLYAAVPLDRVVTGLPGLLAVGSICFVGLGAAVTQARRTSDDLDRLNRTLAAEVERQTASATSVMTRLRLAIDGAGMGMWQWTVGTHDAVVDARQREILDLPPDGPITGDLVFARIHVDDSSLLRGQFERWLREGGPWEYEHRVVDGDGRIRWVAGRAVLLHDADRTIATGVTFDVTRQKQEERGRRRAERQVRLLADCAPATLWATDRAGATTFRSRDWYALTGQAPADDAAFDWLDRVHADDRDRVRELLADAHARRAPFSAEYRVLAADNATVWVLDRGRPYVADDGAFQGLVGSMVDITELKKVSLAQRQVEAALRESDERFRQLADHLDAGFWIAEIDRREPAGAIPAAADAAVAVSVRYVSSGYERLWNIELGPLDERPARWSELVHPDDRMVMRGAFQAFVDGGADYDVEYRLLLPSGRLHWIHERAYAAARDEHGRITLVTGLTIDVTERHRIEQGLRDADRQKDAFLAMLAHELRNPLAPIRTATDVLGAPGIDEATRARVRDIIERQVVHITRLVDDLLDASRLSRGRLQLARAPVDFAAIVRETVADYTEFLSGARVAISLDVPDEPVDVDGDATRLAQVLGNLLHNARKFTPAGGRVHVALRRTPDGEALLIVEDTGGGVAADLLPHIFEPFSQGGQTIDRSPGGLGLGLSLVRGLVELHGGHVTAASGGRGCGTRFEIRLPLGARLAVETPSWTPSPRRGLAILVIEDNVDAAETMRLLLVSEGHEVAVVHSAEAGIDSARRGRPDLVLCDIGLPGHLSGLDVARTLRAEHLGARLVAVSGYAGAEHVRAAEAAGFHLHITKPVGVASVRQIVAETWRAHEPRTASEPRS